ncbi:MAG TPA: SigE family RNA polymerase sigma factor [Mycobacteriales bacterium]|nr:SigE family RNA polymerase sigma factor [Mycobacteriales bacterium]
MEQRDAAFTAFVRDRGAALTRTAFFLTGDRHLAEDLVQTALAQTYVHCHRIRDLSQVEAYARKVLVNANAAWWRRRSATEVPVDTLPDAAGGDDTLAVAEREPLVRALRLLPARQRAAVVLRFYADLSEADTAAALGCSTGSVKKHVSRGLDRLRELLGEPAPPALVLREVEAW